MDSFSKKKKAQNLSTLRQSGRGLRVLNKDRDNCYCGTNREGMIRTGFIRMKKAVEDTQPPQTHQTLQSCNQQQRQLRQQYRQGQDNIIGYQKNFNTLGHKTNQVQQILHSWRGNGNNYNNNHLSSYSNNTNNINIESINGNIDNLIDANNTIYITPTATINIAQPNISHNNRAQLSNATTNTNNNGNDKRQHKITHANNGQQLSRTKHQRYGDDIENIITFEHINVY